jgi:hypothetical protein
MLFESSSVYVVVSKIRPPKHRECFEPQSQTSRRQGAARQKHYVLPLSHSYALSIWIWLLKEEEQETPLALDPDK